MADGAKMIWKEKNRLNRILSAKAQTLDRKIERALVLSGNYVRRMIRNRTPVLSGNLREAIEIGSVILTPHVVYITIYASGKYGTEPYKAYIETGEKKGKQGSGEWQNIGVISKAHNKGGEVGKHAFKRTFEDGVTLQGAMEIIRKTVFKN